MKGLENLLHKLMQQNLANIGYEIKKLLHFYSVYTATSICGVNTSFLYVNMQLMSMYQ